LKILEVER